MGRITKIIEKKLEHLSEILKDFTIKKKKRKVMEINILLAQTAEQKHKALELVRESYVSHFDLDLSMLNPCSEDHETVLEFEKDILIVQSKEDGKILGSLSFIYPKNGKFPCEYYFGLNLPEEDRQVLACVEVGRFATSQSCKNNPIVIIALFLGIAAYVEKRKIKRWIAVIKDNFFDFFMKINLPMKELAQKPNLPPEHLLWKYIENTEQVHTFITDGLVSSHVFNERFGKYVQINRIKICF